MAGTFQTVQVGKSPQRIQTWLAPNDAFLLVNNDLTNQIFIGNDPGTQPIPIPPLGSLALANAKNDTWISTGGVSVTVTALLLPAGTQWTPSPAQVAAQINALGLAKDTTVNAVKTTLGAPAQDGSIATVNTTVGTVNTTLGNPAQQIAPVVLKQLGSIGGAAAATIVPGTPFTAANLIDVSLYQSYDINCYGFAVNPGAVNSAIVYQVVLQWFDDLTSGIPVFEEDWWVWAGRAAPVAGANTLSGCGPMHGHYLTVQVFSVISAANNLTLQYLNLFGSNRPVPSSDWRQNGQQVNPQSNGITVSLGGGTGFDNLLAGIYNLTLTASQLVFIPCGLYAGPVYYRYQCNTSVPLHNVVLANVAGGVSGGLGAGTATAGVLLNIPADTLEHEGQLILPRAPTAFIIQGAVAGNSSYSFTMIAQQSA